MEADSSKRFSPSKLDTYKDCPRRYAYRYIEKIERDGQSVEAFVGSCVHSAFEKLYEGVMHGRILPQAEVEAAFEEEWRKGWSEQITIWDKSYGPEDWKNVGRECVRTYYRSHQPFDEDKTVAIERKVGFPLESSGQPYRIEGFVDRLALAPDGAFEIHDYKTAKSLPVQQDADSDWQLAIYELAVRHAWPDTREVRLIWHYVRHGKDLVSCRSAEQRESLKAEIAALIEAIKRDREFAPRRSALCDWCEYRDLCPLFSHAEKVARLPPALAAQDQGVRLVGELAALDARKKELRGKLKELEIDQERIEQGLLEFAASLGVAAVDGQDASVSITEKEDYKFPSKTHAPEALEALEGELKDTAMWRQVSHLDAHLLLEGYRSREWPQDWRDRAGELIARYAKKTAQKILRLRRKKDPGEG